MRFGATRFATLWGVLLGACALFPSLSGLDDGGLDSSADSTRDGPTDATKGPDVADVGADVHRDADASETSPGFDAGPAPDAPALLCGPHWCLVGPEVCCVDVIAADPTCAAADAGCPDGDVSMACDDPTDCTRLGFSNTFCCVSELPSDVGKSVQCQATCAVQSGTSTRLCDPNDGSVCTTGSSCAPSSTTLPGIYICK